ncbi:MAG: ATP-binding protein [Actinomycetota bacterium]
MDLLPPPFHFAATFLVTVAAFGGAWVTIYRPKFVPDGNVRRFFFGMGWLLLAIGEALHGSRIIASEQSVGITVLRLTAYVMIVAGLQPLIRGRAPEPEDERPSVQGGPLGAEGPSRPKTPVVPAVRRLILALALFAASEVMFVSVDSLSNEEPGTLWLVVHGLRLAGGLAVLAWLGQVVRTSIQARVVAVFIGLMLVVVVAISGSMTQIFTANITEESLQRARREAEVQQGQLEGQVRESVSQAQQVAKLDSFRETFATRVDVLRPLVSALQESGGAFESADFVACLNPTGALLAISATGPGGTSTLEVADLLGLVGTSVVQDALKGQVGTGSVDSVGTGKIAAIGALPVIAPDNVTQVGVVVVGRLIDLSYLEAQRPAEGGEAFLINRTSVLEGTAPVSDGVVPTETSQLAALFDRGTRLALETTIGGAEYFSSYIPLVRANEVIGALVFSTPSDVIGLAQRNLATPLFFIALWATVMGIGLSLLFGSRITQPIRDLTDAAEKVRQGDLSIRVVPRTFDEVGVLGETFDQMTASLGALTRDLTDTAEEQMQLRRQLETILQSMTDGILAVDNQGTIVAFNREAERILEFRQSEAVGKRVDEVLLLSDATGAPISPSIYDLEKGAVSGTVGGPSRAARPVIVTSAPIADENGEVLGAVAVVRDLTREVEIERMKTEFLANISHELRTPITPIKGYADILRRKDVPRAQAVTFLEGILASAERLERIVEMLVDFSAMEAGRLSPHKVVVDFDQITADLVGKWSQLSPKHQFERKGFDSLPTVRADRRLVPLAISELVDNAVKFSPNGGKVTLAADYNKNGRGAGSVLISVTDEGIGIGEDQLLRIGQNFVQADGSETRAYGGLGLGLAYVRRIVEGHGGRLEVRSEPSKGSCFTLVFPAGS